MLEFAAPWALAASPVAAVLVWWLHARAAASRVVPVPALYAWREAGVAGTPRVAGGPRDARWMLRAALAALLFVAAAGPGLQQTAPQTLVVWLDDAPGMGAREDGEPRAARAAAALREALEGADAAQVQLRALRRPGAGRSVGPDAAGNRRLIESLLLGEGPAPGGLPPPHSLDPALQHWLVSDGADGRLAAWLARVPVSRVIQAGAATENAALTRLALRAAADSPDVDRVLVVAQNLGDEAARRTLAIDGPDGTRQRAELVLAARGQPGSRVEWSGIVSARGRGLVHARLMPEDALTADDELQADTTRLDPLPVELDAGCPRSVAAALAAHPGVTTTLHDRQAAVAAVRCQGPAPAVAIPTLWFSASGAGEPVTDVPVWRVDAGPLHELTLPSDWLRAARASRRAVPVLQAGGRTLVGLHPGPPAMLEVALAVDASPLTRQPEFAALIAGFLDLVLGRDTLDPVVSVTRDAAAARIAPGALTPRPAIAPALPGSARLGLTVPLLLLIMALLIIDLAWVLAGHGSAPSRRRGVRA